MASRGGGRSPGAVAVGRGVGRGRGGREAKAASQLSPKYHGPSPGLTPPGATAVLPPPENPGASGSEAGQLRAMARAPR